MRKPNILFLMTDQQRWDALSCTGGWIKTPNLDRIASDGMLFNQCVTNSPVCVPARISLATGLYPHNTGVWNNQHVHLSKESKTWMQQLRSDGYRTSLFGKTHLHPHRRGKSLIEKEDYVRAYGIDDINEIGGPRATAYTISHMTKDWQEKGLLEAYRKDVRARFEEKAFMAKASRLPLEDYADVYVGQKAKVYLEQYQREEPWFCWVSFGGPHEPWDAPEPYASMYKKEDMPRPLDRFRNKCAATEGLFPVSHVGSQPKFDEGDIAAMRANYAGNVTLIDDQIGEILKVIEDRGELDNTIIVMSSDHGEMNGDHGMIYKEVFLDGAVRVPLIVRPAKGFDMDRGLQSAEPVEWMDVGPTILELADVKPMENINAVSLVPSLLKSREKREYAFSEYARSIMVMSDGWKMVLNKDNHVTMLFNRKEDPKESLNLAGAEECREQEGVLRNVILKHLMSSQSRAPAIVCENP